MGRKPGFLAVFLLATAYFVCQHARPSDTWDFHAYILNGEYWFHHGSVFEPWRPPAFPWITGILGFVSRRFAELGYLVIASSLFAWASTRLARSLGQEPARLYAVLCSFYVLTHGLSEGTELLELAFLELFVAALVEDRLSGPWLGLAILSRYTGLGMSPLLAFRGRRAWKDALACLVTVLPWLAYNHARYGSALASFADLYANNIYFRTPQARPWIHALFARPWRLADFWEVAGVWAPFALLGMGSALAKREGLLSRRSLILASIACITVVSYGNIPFKNSRHLFPLALPLGVWALDGLAVLARWITEAGTAFLTYGIFFAQVAIAFATLGPGANGSRYQAAIRDLRTRGLDRCAVTSNGWVELAYEGLASDPAPEEPLARKEIGAGAILVVFHSIRDPDYLRDRAFLDSLPRIARTDRYTILGRGCDPPHPVDELYSRRIADASERIVGKRSEERPCHLLFRLGLLQRACALVPGF